LCLFCLVAVMSLDVNTLFLVTIYVEAMLGLLLLFAWVQNANIMAVAWWGSAHLLRAASVVIFGMWGSVPELISIDLANAILFTAFAVTWTGARVFDGRKASPVGIVAGAAIWLILCRTPFVAESMDAKVLLSSGIITGYTWLTAYEFWQGRREPLVSRWPAIFMLFAHGALFLLRTPLSQLLPWAPNSQVFDSVWLTVLSFEALLFTIAIAFILLAMAKERTELRHKTAALVDPLTGIANRRAFLEGGAQLARRVDAHPRPAAVLVIDLDHFKSINDRFGHACGDKVIARFGVVLKEATPSGIAARFGGEEFAAVLADTNLQGAKLFAQFIRTAISNARISGMPEDCRVTASFGIAEMRPGESFGGLLGRADMALLAAKRDGRNRVRASGAESENAPERVSAAR
jgi:diguanylate cyclase (GGDEF)-like protein